MSFSDDEVKVLKGLVAFIRGGGAAAGKGGAVAPASELDGKFGDPEVRKDPKGWDGPSMVGRHYSQCPAEYLTKLADLLEWMAGKDQEKGDAARKHEKSGKFYWTFNLKDAALARGWAARNAGKTGNPYGGDPFDAPDVVDTLNGGNVPASDDPIPF